MYIKRKFSQHKQVKHGKKGLAFALLIAASLLLSACSLPIKEKAGQPATAGTGEKTLLYTTIFPVYDFTCKLAGDDFEVKNLLPIGAEAHDWEPGSQEMAQLTTAAAIIYSGAGMEPWMDRIAASLQRDDLLLVDSSQGIDLIAAGEQEDLHASATEEHDADEHDADEHGHEHQHGSYDPHIWLDPENVERQMENIAKALIQLQPGKKAEIEKRLAVEKEKLDQLDDNFERALETYKGRKIIVGHDAFGYLCRAYALQQVGIEGLLAESEPSPGRMAEIVDLAKKEGMKVIFVEPLGSTKAAEAIAAEIGGRLSILDPYEGLTEEEKQAGADYYSVMRANLAALKDALSGK